MKILYGVVGEGMGHAMRSRVVLEHLVAQGHEIEIMASGRACDFLQKRFEGTNPIHGLHMIYEENRVRRGKTLWSNVLGGLTGTPKNIQAYFDLIRDFRPEVVISDFESWTYLYAQLHRLPILSIDNMQIINRCTHPPEVIAGDEADFQVTKAFVKGKLPFCQHYVITTFFRPPVRKEKTTLVPPILRPEILEAKPSRGDHLLVYQTAEGNDGLADILQSAGVPCHVYGMRRNLTGDQVEGNLTYRPFSEKGFVTDLASCRGVVAGGGFTLMGEAVYLHKPMLAIPLERQFEQVMNSRYLELRGFGRWTRKLDDPQILKDFLRDIPACEEKLARYVQDGNQEMFQTVDELLDRAAAGVLRANVI
ncbi:MAG: glycosyltransferase family protein [Polyangiaceae bacterium]